MTKEKLLNNDNQDPYSSIVQSMSNGEILRPELLTQENFAMLKRQEFNASLQSYILSVPARSRFLLSALLTRLIKQGSILENAVMISNYFFFCIGEAISNGRLTEEELKNRGFDDSVQYNAFAYFAELQESVAFKGEPNMEPFVQKLKKSYKKRH
ncbi:MAG: hypothetical protein PHD02_00815 [Bacilli bacterium]|nr:hypothetical protein [Bacilli bacterium]